MKFGIWYLLESPMDTHQRDYEEMLDQIAYAEELGFDSVWVAEHHSSPFGIIPSPQVVLAAIAQRTKKMRIGSSVSILTLNNPVRIAEDYAMVDVLSGGRLEFGVGRGYQPGEFKNLGVSMENTRERFNEALEIILGLWQNETFSYDGEFYKIEDAFIRPKPIQQPHPPAYVASMSDSTFEIMANYGLNPTVNPMFSSEEQALNNLKNARKTMLERGISEDKLDFPYMVMTHVAENVETARQNTEKYLDWHFNTLPALISGGNAGKAAQNYENYNKISETLNGITFDELREKGIIKVDGPEALIDYINHLEDTFGMKQFLTWHRFGGMDDKTVRKSMEMMAKEVMPYFKNKEKKKVTQS
jgi:alkanesulfonate monooxygenase SsuD/methylene tetrahydromethanopterin reductase-like flavin-dependent oxidoreductase (luciferase family)